MLSAAFKISVGFILGEGDEGFPTDKPRVGFRSVTQAVVNTDAERSIF